MCPSRAQKFTLECCYYKSRSLINPKQLIIIYNLNEDYIQNFALKMYFKLKLKKMSGE